MNLIFFDIDGTLAIGKEVPKSASEAIHRLRQKGDMVFICTGRWKSYAEHFFGPYADGFICSNGRLAFQGDRVLSDHPLSKGQIEELTRRLLEVGADHMFYGEGAAYYGGSPDHFKERAAGFERGDVKESIDPERDKVYNLDVYFNDRGHRERIEEALKGIGVLNPHGAHPSGDVTVLGVDKGEALKKVAEHLGVPMENTYAFGDGANDICMIEAAGHGIAMGNGVDEVKQKAEYVTTGIREDGVKNGLEHYGLLS